MSDIEPDYGSDQEVSENHSKLIEAVSKLDKGQRVKKPQRSEPSLEVSEFHLVKSGIADKDAIHIKELAQTLGRKGHHAEISKKLRSAQQKASVLPKPLEKPAADKLKRIIGFENTKKELQAWNAIVTRNRTAESLTFPLSQRSTKKETSNEFTKRFRLQSDLEKELAALEPPKPVEEKVDEFPLTLEEIMQRRKEAAKFRAQQSYKEAKAFRQNKIKSKKFHRIQRKAKIKQQLKEFEELQKTDPQAALEKLEELDKSRAQERMSLRHKSTGQWAKNKQIRAKYDKESRQVLAQQLSISKALTQKIRSNEDSDAEEEATNEILKPSANDKDNPWVNGVKTSSEIDDFVSGYRKYWDDKNKESKIEKESTESEIPKEQPANEPKVEVAKNREIKKSAVSKKKQKIYPENPVESVTLENWRENVKVAEREIRSPDRIEIPNKREIKKMKKLLNERTRKAIVNKIEKSTEPSKPNKIKRKKIPAKPEKAGTSEWLVEPVVNETTNQLFRKKSLKIDDLFDAMEDKLTSQVSTKLASIKKDLATPAAANKKSQTRKKRANLNSRADDLSFKKAKLRPDYDEEMVETAGISGNQAMRKRPENPDIMNGVIETSSAPKPSDEIDPNKFINVKPKHLDSMMPDEITGGDEALDDSENENDQHNIISEAFADDDVVGEFRKEKGDEIKKSQPEDLDLRLPGWGSWGGKDIPIKRKKRRFIVKFPKEVKRRDENKGDVIIIEEKNPKIREHQVSELPHPFNSVKDFETSIRAPIGRNFVTENAHKRFIDPAVKTKLGQIIEPMDAQVLVNKKSKSRKSTTGLKRNEKDVERIDL